MERLLGWKFWAFTITGYVFATLTVGQTLYAWLTTGIGSDWLPEFQTAATAVCGAVFFVLFLKPVWRSIWRWPIIGEWLSQNVFPDLNGEWEVDTMISNWPRIEAMKNAAKDASLPRYDADNDFEQIGFLDVTTFEKAVIDQGWGSLRMTLYPKKDGSVANKAEQSITIAFDLLRDHKGKPAIAYLYIQTNKMINLAATDVPDFLGGALLNVHQGDSGEIKLHGTYFTARNWGTGLNAAGEVTFVQRRAK